MRQLHDEMTTNQGSHSCNPSWLLSASLGLLWTGIAISSSCSAFQAEYQHINTITTLRSLILNPSFNKASFLIYLNKGSLSSEPNPSLSSVSAILSSSCLHSIFLLGHQNSAMSHQSICPVSLYLPKPKTTKCSISHNLTKISPS